MYGVASAHESPDPDAPLLRVLVVDDDPDDRLLIADLLADIGTVGQVETAGSFAEGREAILAARHDVYLVDYRLGARTGLDLISEAADRANGPFIVLTGYSSSEADRMAADAGAQDYLEKDGLDAAMLARSIRYAVTSWGAKAELRRRAERQGALARLSRHALDDPDVPKFLEEALDGVVVALGADYGVVCELGTTGDLMVRAELGVACDAHEGLAAPVVHGDGSPWGMLGVQIRAGEERSGDLVFLELVANLVATVVERAEVVAHRNRLVEILEATPDFVGTMTVDGTVTYLNRAGRSLHGGDELGSGPDFRSFYPEPAYRLLEQIAMPHALTQGVWSGRATVLGDDGSEIPVSEVVVVHRDREGAVTHISAVAHDLSEDLAAEQAASAQIGFQASLLDQVHNAVIATDLNGLITYWNRAATEMFGWQRDEVMGQPIVELVTADRAESAGAIAEQANALNEHGVWEGEGLLRRKDGSIFIARMADSLLYEESGQPIGVVGVKADVTRMREMETEIHRQETLAAAVLRSVHFPVAVLDPNGVITAVNRAWVEFGRANGGDPDRCGIGSSYLEVCKAAGAEPGAQEARMGIEAVLRGDMSSFSLGYECSSPDEERWFEMEVHPIAGEGAVVVHSNVTAERRHRITLEETLDAKDRFIASLSHEIRTPLTAVVGLAEELRAGTYSDHEVREFHHLIADQAQELSLLVDDLLIAARIESGTISYRSVPVALGVELEHVLAPWRITGVAIEVRDSAGATGIADPGRVRQILRNLVSNAVRYGAPPIVIDVVSLDEDVAVVVSDHGVGVSGAVLDRLFEPYASYGGANGLPSAVGLGLHVSRDLAEGMGGSLSYRRERNVTVFELRLPAFR